MKHMLILTFLLFFITLSLQQVSCGKGKKKEVYQQKFTITTVDLLDAITQTGEVKPIIKVDLKSEASGRIEKVYIKEGQRVQRGDKIVEIDPSRLLYQKDRLDLSVQKALIEKELALKNLNDAKKLKRTGTISAKDVFDLENRLNLYDINYKQNLLELKDVTDQLKKTTVRSPMEGVITSLDIEEGEIAVSAMSGLQAGTAIATIADISQLEVVSQIGEADYVHLKRGQKVVIKSEAVEHISTTGTINFIALSAKKQNNDELGTFEVRIMVDSLIPGIAPGINVNVEFVILEKKGVLGVPNHFVKKQGKEYFVERFVPENSQKGNDPTIQKKALTKIEIGATDFHHYEILAGLKKGDIVVFQEDHGAAAREKRKRKGK